MLWKIRWYSLEKKLLFIRSGFWSCRLVMKVVEIEIFSLSKKFLICKSEWKNLVIIGK